MKLLSRLLCAVAAMSLSLTVALSASAAEVPYNQAQYAAALSQGKPVVVDFYADWCPVCRAQKPVIAGIMQAPAMAGVTVFVANFDTETELKKSLRVTGQSTLVVFKDGKEVARSTGQTKQEPLLALIAQSL